MMAACTTLDHTANQIRLRCACGFRAASNKKTPSVAYRPTIIMKYCDSYGAPVMPGPARRPHHGEGIQEEHQYAEYGECELEKFVRGAHVVLRSLPCGGQYAPMPRRRLHGVGIGHVHVRRHVTHSRRSERRHKRTTRRL